MRTALFLLALLLSGCSGPIYVLLFNNSGVPLVINSGNSSVSIAPSSSETFAISYVVRTFAIEASGRTLQYKYDTIPGGYYELHGFGYYRIHLQAQPDFTLALVKPKVSLPASETLAQPDGFPLRPL